MFENISGAKGRNSAIPIKCEQDVKIVPNKPSSSPTSFELEGVTVHFPFDPYPCQKDYMRTVIRALHRGENALLESPTGTGKTLCLLCSALAWQREQIRRISDVSSQQALATPQIEINGIDATREPKGGQVVQNTSGRPPTIVYASRTHSQLSQVVHELRNTRYRPNHAVLASREQLCINEKVVSRPTASMINNDCAKLNKLRKCKFRNNLEHFPGPPPTPGEAPTLQPVLDVEDLVLMGKQHKVCPFYHTRELVTKGADLVLLPYNYLFERDARDTLNIVWKDAVVIFDEAHNLESFASDATSFELTGLDIAGAILEVTRGIDFVSQLNEHGSNENEGLKVENLLKLKAMFLRIEEFLDSKVKPEGGSFAGEYIFEVFRWASITFQNHEIFISFVKGFIERLAESRGGAAGTPKLDHFLKCVKRAYAGSTEAQCLAKAKAFRVFVSAKKQTAKKEPRTMSYWCFAPSLAMRELADLGLRSVIVTSGTLSPVMSYSLELGIPFPLKLENPHIIKQNQVHVRVIGRGVSNKLLKSTFERRDEKEYLLELGNTLVALSRVIPGGMLIFYPSYGVMEKCCEAWGGPSSKAFFGIQKCGKSPFFAPRGKNGSSNPSSRFSFPRIATSLESHQQTLCIWKRLLAQKSIVVEPRTSADMKDAIDEFDKYIAAKNSKGCILMGVCRGKISEGIDFADERARAVIITGIPFPPFQDPKVKLKREYLDNNKASSAGATFKEEGGFGTGLSKTNEDCISGAEWYAQQAHRAVNQAVGRVIRHRFDYGAVLLLDSRFDEDRNQSGMSQWVRPYIQKDNGFGIAISGLVKFYKGAMSDPDLNKKIVSNSLKKYFNPKNSSKPDLEYEADQETTEDEAIRIAVIRASDSPSKVNDDTIDGYVRPDRIITRLELKSEELKSNNVTISETQQSSHESKDFACGINAVFFDKKISHKPEVDKQDLGSSSWDDFDTKATRTKSLKIVQGGPKTDWTRLKSVATNDLSQENRRNAHGSSPQDNKEAAATFFSAARQSMSTEDFRDLKDRLLKLKAFGDVHDTKSYLNAATDLLSFLMPYTEAKLASLFLPVLPKQYQNTVRALSLENKAVDRIDRLKRSIEDQVGVNGLKSKLFRSEQKTSSVNIQKDNKPLQDETHAKGQTRDLGSEKCTHVDKTLQSQTKRPDFVDSIKSKTSNMPSNSVEAFLNQASSESFLKKMKNKPTLSRKFMCNIPKGLMCMICDNALTEPLLAECGHSACSACWSQWLSEKENLTCPVCRNPTSKKELSRVVFHDHTAGEKPPTLSQICPNEFSQDEETDD